MDWALAAEGDRLFQGVSNCGKFCWTSVNSSMCARQERLGAALHRIVNVDPALCIVKQRNE